MDSDSKIRSAGPTDFEDVLDLYLKLYRSQTPFYGCDIVEGPKTHNWVWNLFGQALAGNGICLIAEHKGYPVGVTLAVEATMPFDTMLGRTAIGYGTFVKHGFRKSGVARRLYSMLREQLIADGYKHYIGAFLNENKNVQGVLKEVGLVPFQTAVRWDLC